MYWMEMEKNLRLIKVKANTYIHKANSVSLWGENILLKHERGTAGWTKA